MEDFPTIFESQCILVEKKKVEKNRFKEIKKSQRIQRIEPKIDIKKEIRSDHRLEIIDIEPDTNLTTFEGSILRPTFILEKGLKKYLDSDLTTYNKNRFRRSELSYLIKVDRIKPLEKKILDFYPEPKEDLVFLSQINYLDLYKEGRIRPTNFELFLTSEELFKIIKILHRLAFDPEESFEPKNWYRIRKYLYILLLENQISELDFESNQNLILLIPILNYIFKVKSKFILETFISLIQSFIFNLFFIIKKLDLDKNNFFY